MRFRSVVLGIWPTVLSTRNPREPALDGPITELRAGINGSVPDALIGFQDNVREPRWQPWLNERTVRAGILKMRAGTRYPAHDHPGSLAVSLVLAGRVIVTGFESPESPASGRVVHLLSLGRRLLRTGEFAMALPEYGNVQELSALTDVALLDVAISRFRPPAHYWYFPLGPIADRFSEVPAIALMQGSP